MGRADVDNAFLGGRGRGQLLETAAKSLSIPGQQVGNRHRALK